MKKRNIIILCVVAALAIAAIIINRQGSKNATFDQDFHIEDVASITKIFIADKQDHHVTLQRIADTTSEEQWIVDGAYPANQPFVETLLSTLHDMRIRQQVNRNAVPNIIKRLSAESIKVEVFQRKPLIDWFGGKLQLFAREKKVVTYYVGHETRDMMASYMFREGDKVPYIIHIPGFRGYLTPRFSSDSYAWRSHTIVHWNIKKLQSVSLDIPATPNESFRVAREGDGFVFEQGAAHNRIATFDTARVAQMLTCFANLNFDEFACVVPNSRMDSSFSSEPRAILHVTNTDGVTREIKTFLKYTNPDDQEIMSDTTMYSVFDLNRLYALIDNKDSVLIQYFVFDNILQPASYFLGMDKSTFAR